MKFVEFVIQVIILLSPQVGPGPTYTMTFGNFRPELSTLGDSLTYHKGSAFSTRLVYFLNKYINLAGTGTWMVIPDPVPMSLEEGGFGITTAIAPRQLVPTLLKEQDMLHPSCMKIPRKVARGLNPGRAPPGPSLQVLTQ